MRAFRRLPRSMWRAPRVYADLDESIRHATWLELFFDLVFVVAIAELGVYLHDDLTIAGFVSFAGLFALVALEALFRSDADVELSGQEA